MIKSGLEGSILGAFEGVGPPWEASCRHWELSGGPLEVLGSILGVIWEPFGLHLVTLECHFGGLWVVVGHIYCHFSKKWRMYENHKENNVF